MHLPGGRDLTRSVIAIDIGATKMAAGLVDGTGRVVSSSLAATPRDGAEEEIWCALAGLLDVAVGGMRVGGMRDKDRPLACGVGCAGPMDRDGLVSPLNIPGWRRFPLRSRLAEHTGLPTAVDNDAKALALAEGWVGGAAGWSNYLSMVVSTGIGGGIVLDGRLLDGDSTNAGHIGHVIVEPEGRRCACGARGCLEAEASGTAIAAMTGQPPASAAPSMIARAGRLVGRGVATVANLLDLQLATVAGSVALGYGRPFFDAAQEELTARACLPFSAPCQIVPSRLGGSGPLIGAGAVGWKALLAG
jgi:glucokinase